MTTKPRIWTIAAALAALSGTPAISAQTPTEPVAADPKVEPAVSAKPNFVYRAGEELLGLIVARRADGTIVANHTSHASHASHHSHHSHYSSR